MQGTKRTFARLFKQAGVSLAVCLVVCNLLGASLPILGSDIAYAAGCPSGNQPGNPGVALIGVCLSKNGNQITNAAGYTVTLKRPLGGSQQSYSTTFSGGLFIGSISPWPLCNGANKGSALYQSTQITVTVTGAATATQTFDECTLAIDFMGVVSLDVSAGNKGAGTGSLHGCVAYVAPDGTVQPFLNQQNPAGAGSNGIPATATINGPSGTFTPGFDSSGCLTQGATGGSGAIIQNLPAGSYTMTATYIPGITPHGTIGTEACTNYKFTITANKTTTFKCLAKHAGGVFSTTAFTSKSPPSGSVSDGPPSCDTSGNALAVFMCPVFNFMAKGSQDIFNNIIAPFLYTTPISTSPNDSSFKVWSAFRLYGNVFLVLALLAAVIAEAYGGGVVEAYTVRKMLPRVLLTAILINVSVYIVALLVDITNVIGRSLGDLLTAPLRAAGAYHIDTGGGGAGGTATSAVVGVFTIGLLGLLVAKHFTGFAGAAGAKNGGSWGASALELMFVILIPIILACIAILVTLIIRKGLILFLVMISPVAFALYVLPNTEKYFRKWWDLLIEALMVYPIIVAIFALADIMSVTVLAANNVKGSELVPNSTSGDITLAGGHVFAVMIAFFMQFIPLLAIPFAFRMAGGVLGKVHEFGTNAGGKLKESGWYQNRKASAQQKYRNAQMEGRRNYYANKLSSLGDTGKGEDASWAARRYRRHVMTQLGRAGETQAGAEGEVLKHLQNTGAAHNQGALQAAMAGASSSEALRNLQSDYQQSGLSEAAAREKAEESVAAWNATGLGWGGAARSAALTAAAQDGTVFDGSTGVSARKEQARAISRVSGNDRETLARVSGNVYAANGQAGRKDLAEGYGSTRDDAIAYNEGRFDDAKADEETFASFETMTAMQIGSQKNDSVAQYSNAAASMATRENARLHEASTALQRTDLSQTDRARFTDQANDAQTKLSRVQAAYERVDEASQMGYIPAIHARQIRTAMGGPNAAAGQQLDAHDAATAAGTAQQDFGNGPAPQPGEVTVTTKGPNKGAEGNEGLVVVPRDQYTGRGQGRGRSNGPRIDPDTGMPFGI